MNMAEYSAYTGILPHNLARLFQLTPTYIGRIMKGAKPSYKTAVRISLITSQKIRVEDLIPNFVQKNKHRLEK